MATPESAILGMECLRWLSNVRANLRDNATAYKAQAAVVGADLTKLAGVMTADATELLKTIAAIETIAADATKRAKLVECLSVFSITLGTANSDVTELKNAAVALRDAVKTTKAEIDTAANAVLANVRSYELPKRI